MGFNWGFKGLIVTGLHTSDVPQSSTHRISGLHFCGCRFGLFLWLQGS